jgi:hypothetical protein
MLLDGHQRLQTELDRYSSSSSNPPSTSGGIDPLGLPAPHTPPPIADPFFKNYINLSPHESPSKGFPDAGPSDSPEEFVFPPESDLMSLFPNFTIYSKGDCIDNPGESLALHGEHNMGASNPGMSTSILDNTTQSNPAGPSSQASDSGEPIVPPIATLSTAGGIPEDEGMADTN